MGMELIAKRSLFSTSPSHCVSDGKRERGVNVLVTQNLDVR